MNKELINQLRNIDNLNADKLAEVLLKKGQEAQRQQGKLKLIEQKIEIVLSEQASLEELAAKWLQNGEYDDMPDVCKHLSEEHKQKISAAMKGRKISEQAKERMRENSQRMTVYQYTPDGKLVHIWKSTREVQRKLGWCNSNIARCCNGKQKKCHGYIWRYSPIEDIQLAEMRITGVYK